MVDFRQTSEPQTHFWTKISYCPAWKQESLQNVGRGQLALEKAVYAYLQARWIQKHLFHLSPLCSIGENRGNLTPFHSSLHAVVALSLIQNQSISSTPTTTAVSQAPAQLPPYTIYWREKHNLRSRHYRNEGDCRSNKHQTSQMSINSPDMCCT